MAEETNKEIEWIFKNSYETLALEGLGEFSKEEIACYHSNIICKDIENYNFVSIDGAGMVIFHNSEWDSKYLKKRIAKIDFILTINNVSDRESLYEALINKTFSELKDRDIDMAFFRSSLKNKILNEIFSSLRAHPVSVLVTMFSQGISKISPNPSLEKRGTPFSMDNNMLNLQIRRPELSEFDKIKALMAIGYENRFLYEPFFAECDVRNLYGQWALNDMKGRVEAVLTAVSEGNICGFIAYDYLTIDSRRYGVIDMIVVDKRFRKKGIGAALLNEAIERMRPDTDGIILGVESAKKAVVNLYSKLGFKAMDSAYTYHTKLNL